MKRIKLAAVLLTACITMCGCAGSASFDGASELRAAKTLFEEMTSGSLSVVNNLNSGEYQHFDFCYSVYGTLAYTYTANDGASDTYYEYHNGSEIVRTTENAGEWTVIGEGTPDYYSYTKSNRSSYTSAAFLAFFESAVTTAAVTALDGGNLITLSYDMDKLNALGMLSADVGALTAFTEEVELDAGGYCTRLTQTGTGELDGKATDYSYTIIIENINSVEIVECPVPLWEQVA